MNGINIPDPVSTINVCRCGEGYPTLQGNIDVSSYYRMPQIVNSISCILIILTIGLHNGFQGLETVAPRGCILPMPPHLHQLVYFHFLH